MSKFPSIANFLEEIGGLRLTDAAKIWNEAIGIKVTWLGTVPLASQLYVVSKFALKQLPVQWQAPRTQVRHSTAQQLSSHQQPCKHGPLQAPSPGKQSKRWPPLFFEGKWALTKQLWFHHLPSFPEGQVMTC